MEFFDRYVSLQSVRLWLWAGSHGMGWPYENSKYGAFGHRRFFPFFGGGQCSKMSFSSEILRVQILGVGSNRFWSRKRWCFENMATPCNPWLDNGGHGRSLKGEVPPLTPRKGDFVPWLQGWHYPKRRYMWRQSIVYSCLFYNIYTRKYVYIYIYVNTFVNNK